MQMVEIFALGRSRNQDFLNAAAQMLLGIIRVGEQPGRLHDNIDAEIFGQSIPSPGSALLEHPDALLVDRNAVGIERNLVGRFPRTESYFNR